MADGSLIFDTGIDSSGFDSGVKTLSASASVAIGNIVSNIVTQISSALAQIPQQMIAVGSGFEASMSQVAATMGITSAAAEFDVLSEAAKEMGANTQFSASQAAEALNYLALAGYDAEKSVSALPTVLNVAAAGGMELASASDMITDAMSALGLETSEMSRFADQLAVTSQKSNTSVSQLGEAILTVGGTAKTLSGGVTEMNTALGILADNGIKGSEGGTMLRNTILSLSAPTSTAAAALADLGVTAFDTQGNMRPLQDTFSDLNAALSKLNQQEQTETLGKIFNKVDLKGINALLGTSAERFDELSGYIGSCAGAAEDMAETMNDNLQGDLTIMQSALEGLGVAAYEKFQTPMRTAVQSVTEDLSALTASLTEGELSDSFDTIASTASSALETLSSVLSNDIIPTVITGFSTIIEHGREIITVIEGIAAAAAVIGTATVITKAMTAVQAANVQLALLAMESGKAAVAQTALAGGLTLSEIAAGVLTGQITLLTAAKSLWKKVTDAAAAALAKLNSVLSLTTLAIAAVGAVLIAGALAFKDYVDSMEIAAAADPWTEKYDEQTRAIREQQNALEELKAARDEANNADNAEIDNLQRLWGELQNYVDETGKVVSENTRAAEIIGLLNENYGMNIGYINGQIEGYGDLAASMDDYIAKLRTEAQIRNGQGAYDEAVANYQEYTKQREALLEELDMKERAFTKAREDGNTDVAMVFGEQANSIKNQIAALDEIIAEYSDAMEEYEGLFSYSSGGASAGEYKSSAQMAAEEYGKNYADTMRRQVEEISAAQTAATKKLSEEWKNLEHQYAMGVIASETELYARKSALLEQYGNADLEDHWKYYEDLTDMEKDFAKQSAEDAKKAAEDAKKAREQQMSSEWNNISHMQSLGVLSAEDAYKKQLEFIKKYCAEYSDEWYEYYQKIIDYQREAQKKQVEEVRKNISEITEKYKQSYKNLESEINGYKSRLTSVGSLFSVTEKTDENGNKSKTAAVENLKKQMEEMKKYHKYITELKESGASKELLSELTAMDFEDGSFIAKNLAKMSDAEFKNINDLYKEKEELAKELSEELFAPEKESLNKELSSGISAEFRKLPEEIRAVGAESLNAFIDGFTAGNLNDISDKFLEKFSEDCEKGIDAALQNTDLNYDALMNADGYSAGKSAGDNFVLGYMEAMENLRSAIAAEHYSVSAEYSAKTGVSAAEKTPKKSEKIIIENHVNTAVQMGKEIIGKAAYMYEKEYERRTNG